MVKQRYLFVLAGLAIQVVITWLIFESVDITFISSFFSVLIFGVSIINHLAYKAHTRSVTDRHTQQIHGLETEINRLREFNREHLTTNRKLKAYVKTHMIKLNENSIDFVNTAECMDHPVLLANANGDVTWCNKASEKLYGLSNWSINRSRVTDLMEFSQEMSFDQLIDQLYKNGEQDLELKIATRDGKDIWLDSHFSLQKSKTKKTTGILILQTDITDSRLNEEDLKKSLKIARIAEQELQQIINKQLETNEQLMITENQLRSVLEKEQESKAILNQTLDVLKDTQGQLIHSEKMASLGQLTAGIAHEINNPINFIYNGIGALKKSLVEINEILNTYENLEGNLSDDNQETVKKVKSNLDYEILREEMAELIVDIEEGAVRTIEIVKGLRVFSRLDEEDQKEADLNECLDATIALLHNKVKGRIQVVKEFDQNLSPISCFPGQLNQVFMNMINNAIQSFPEDQSNCEIVVRTGCSDNKVVIDISDNGCGIPEDVQKKIFEPFYTTKPVGVGTGLGLSISFGIIQKHNGDIELKSEPGKGTTFSIIIPIHNESSKEYANAS